MNNNKSPIISDFIDLIHIAEAADAPILVRSTGNPRYVYALDSNQLQQIYKSSLTHKHGLHDNGTLVDILLENATQRLGNDIDEQSKTTHLNTLRAEFEAADTDTLIHVIIQEREQADRTHNAIYGLTRQAEDLASEYIQPGLPAKQSKAAAIAIACDVILYGTFDESSPFFEDKINGHFPITFITYENLDHKFIQECLVEGPMNTTTINKTLAYELADYLDGFDAYDPDTNQQLQITPDALSPLMNEEDTFKIVGPIAMAAVASCAQEEFGYFSAATILQQLECLDEDQDPDTLKIYIEGVTAKTLGSPQASMPRGSTGSFSEEGQNTPPPTPD